MTHQTKPNSWVYQDTDSTTQLSYALQIDPAPFTVSIPGDNPIIGSLEFVVTNPTGSDIDITSITFPLTIGSTSDCITATTAGISTLVNDNVNWNVVGPTSPVTSGTANYTLEPTSGNPFPLPAGASVVVQIFGFQTLTIPGNSTISIKEMIVSAPPAFTDFIVTTFPTGFYFNSLTATVESGSSLIPVAQVDTGSSVILAWNSSVVDTSAFTIYYSNAGSGQQTAQPSDVGEWASPPLSSDTVFTIAVTLSLDGGQKFTASMSTSVSVQNPSLIAAAMTTGTATITGAASVSGTLTTNAIISTGVTVNGAFSSGSATVSGAVSADSVGVTNGLTAASANITGALTTGSATVSGVLTASSATVTGALSANTITSPAVSTNALTVNNIINASGGTNMNGIVSLCAAPDYSLGTVGVGGNVAPNATLTVTNTQYTGSGIFISAPNLQNGLGWGLNAHTSCINQTGSWTKFTDVALKKNIKPYTDGLEQILKLNPTKFQYTHETGMSPDHELVGISGQELQAVAPYMVGKGKLRPDTDEEYLYTDNGAMTYMLINAIKELKAELDALKAEKSSKKK